MTQDHHPDCASLRPTTDGCGPFECSCAPIRVADAGGLLRLIAEWREEADTPVETGRGYLSAMDSASRDTKAACADALEEAISARYSLVELTQMGMDMGKKQWVRVE